MATIKIVQFKNPAAVVGFPTVVASLGLEDQMKVFLVAAAIAAVSLLGSGSSQPAEAAWQAVSCSGGSQNPRCDVYRRVKQEQRRRQQAPTTGAGQQQPAPR